MAGDWLKWGKGLAVKQEVLQIAARLMIPNTQAAGTLMLAMEWLDDNVQEYDKDGHAHVTLGALHAHALDSIVGVSGFTDALAEVGWLNEKDGVLVFKNVGRHNGNSAKSRALAANRQRAHREKEPVTLPSRSKRDASSLLSSSVPSLSEWLEEAAKERPDWPKADAEAAWHHYEANGWKVGKNPVKRWQSCIATCYHNWQGKNPNKGQGEFDNAF